MKSIKKLVSIVIPTRNSDRFLKDCLSSIQKQSYQQIEVIVVDSNSQDETIKIAKANKATIYQYSTNIAGSLFDAPYKRNYGIDKAKGAYVYYVDADMVLTKNVIKQAVEACEKGADAVIVAEDSVGYGVWARAKNLERRCYWGDDLVEAPRFFNKSVWKTLGGLDESLGGGGEDWDFYQKLTENGYKTVRIESKVKHNEGDLKLTHLIKKRFMYGKESMKYLKKRPKKGFVSYFPIRYSYIKNWRLFVSRPLDAFFFIIMRSSEYIAGFSGIIYSMVLQKTSADKNEEIFETSNVMRQEKMLGIHEDISKYAEKNKRRLKSILTADLGSGVGNISIPLLRLGHKIDAYELNKDSIKEMKKRVEKEKLSGNVQFISSSIEDISVKTKYDVVLLIEVIEHTDYPDTILKKINTLLVKDGLFIMHMPNGYCLHEIFITRPTIWFRKLFGIHKPKGYHHVQFFTYHKINSLLKKHGFRVVKLRKSSLFPYIPILHTIGWMQKLDSILSKKASKHLVGGWQITCKKIK